MSNYLKLLFIIATVSMTQFALPASLPIINTQQSDRLGKLIDYHGKEIEFWHKCFKPSVIKTSELNYIMNYTSCLVDGLAHDVTNGKHGYVDKDGKVVIPHQFKSASSFSDGLARVAVDVENDDTIFGRHIGYIDKSGKLVIDPIYIVGQDYSEGLIGVLNEDYKYGFIDRHGNIVLPLIYDLPVNCGDSSDCFAIDMAYAPYSYVFHDGVALVKLHGKWQFIDKQGNTVEYLTQ